MSHHQRQTFASSSRAPPMVTSSNFPLSTSLNKPGRYNSDRAGPFPDSAAVVSYHRDWSSHMVSLIRAVSSSTSPLSSYSQLDVIGRRQAHSSRPRTSSSSTSSSAARIPAHNPNRRQSAPSTSNTATHAPPTTATMEKSTSLTGFGRPLFAMSPVPTTTSNKVAANFNVELDPLDPGPPGAVMELSTGSFSRSHGSESVPGSSSRSRVSTTTKSNFKYQAKSRNLSLSFSEEEEEEQTAATSMSPSDSDIKDSEYRGERLQSPKKTELVVLDESGEDQSQEWTARPLDPHRNDDCSTLASTLIHRLDISPPSVNATPAAPRLDHRPLAASPSEERHRQMEQQRAWELEGRRIWLSIPQGFSLRLEKNLKRNQRSSSVPTSSGDENRADNNNHTFDSFVAPISPRRIDEHFGLGLQFAEVDRLSYERQQEMEKNRVVKDDLPQRRQSESDDVTTELPAIRSSFEMSPRVEQQGDRSDLVSSTVPTSRASSRGLSRRQSTHESRPPAMSHPNQPRFGHETTMGNVDPVSVGSLTHGTAYQTAAVMSTAIRNRQGNLSTIRSNDHDHSRRDHEALERSYLARKEERHRRRAAELCRRVERWISNIETSPFDPSHPPPEILPPIPSPSTSTAHFSTSPSSFTYTLPVPHSTRHSTTSSGTNTVVSTPVLGRGGLSFASTPNRSVLPSNNSPISTGRASVSLFSGGGNKYSKGLTLLSPPSNTTLISTTAATDSSGLMTESGDRHKSSSLRSYQPELVLPLIPGETGPRAACTPPNQLTVSLASKLKTLEVTKDRSDLDQWVNFNQPIMLANPGHMDAAL